MPRPSNPRRYQAVESIRRLCAEHGLMEGCRLAREQFADIPDGTWGRWRVEAVGRAPEREEFERDARANMAAKVRENIPSVGQLVPVAEPLSAQRRALDFWRMLEELDEDARLMREFAITTGLDGKRRVKLPFALRDAHRMRCDLIRLALQHAEVAWSTERAARVHDAILQEVSAESPELAGRIIARLKRVASEAEQRGF